MLAASGVGSGCPRVSLLSGFQFDRPESSPGRRLLLEHLLVGDCSCEPT
jgi:hypothetical protein